MSKKDTAEKLVTIVSKTLEKDPNYQSLSDEGKSICIIMGCCSVISKVCNLISKGMKDFYEKYH